ncbi:ComEC/Rec2 family competence protein [Mesomycoplasma molare]|uniref:ComEC/Rec2 family competence protein n=2 Tax=Mesomycoplasma molare TaxID=171288 RepID=A0ABY5TV15_9BACT|nr:ComEC/Rec2 family competence protein [Mesomycoplasma molare]UWD34504.1 ComEC/Rec2 family competence protein [Mesomycoplasma molare]
MDEQILENEEIDISNIKFTKVAKNNYIFLINGKNVLIQNYNIEENYSYILKGKISKIEYKNYKLSWYLFLKSKNIVYEMKSIEFINKFSRIDNILFRIKNFISSGKENYKKIIPLLLISENNYDQSSVVEKLKSISIYHLFVISGFHITLISKLLKKILTFIKLDFFYSLFIWILFVLFYLLILNFAISALRAFIFLLFLEINGKLLKNKFSKIEILLFTALLFIFVNFYIIFSFSFILTFLITLNILYILEFNIKSKLLNTFFISFTSSFLSYFILNLTKKYDYNVLSTFNSIIFSWIVSLFYAISIFLIFWKDFLNYLSWLFLKLIDYYINFQVFLKINLDFLFFLNIIFIYFVSLESIRIKIFNNYKIFTYKE